MEDKNYIVIRDELQKRISAAQVDSHGNLQNLNVLLEGFYREFLNILYGWQLVNANAEKQNAAGIDLIDRTNRIIIQVSATCTHGKIQHSLEEFNEAGTWQFCFVPILLNSPKPKTPFKLRTGVRFDPETDILDTARLMHDVHHASADTVFRLKTFVNLEKYDLWENFDALLREEWKQHPSRRLMGRDEIDRRLFPNVKDDKPFNAMGEDADSGTVSPVWRIIAGTWRGETRRHVVIEGDGGIGKTVTLFSLVTAPERWRPAPAVYVPMHALVTRDGRCLDLSDYLKRCSDTYGEKLCQLAEREWAGAPTLLVLLDGFNEVAPNKRRDILNLLNEWQKTHRGAQFIAVSRPMNGLDVARELHGELLPIWLQPLSDGTVRDYLGNATPPEGAPVWEVLRLPLFLTLYKKTNGLDGKTSGGYPLAPKLAENGGALIWNYLQRELLREDNEAWALRCAVASEYIIPYLAYRMVRDYAFTLTLDDAKRYIAEAAETLKRGKLPRHLAELFEIYEERELDAPSFDGVDWRQVILQETGVLVYKENACAFLHQNFRDALAGLYLVNQAEAAEADELPEVWRKPQSPELLDFAAELMDEETAQALWEKNHNLRPTESAATYAQLELQRRRNRTGGVPLDFSGTDLSEISLARYCGQDGIDLRLFREARLSVGTKLSRGTFRGQGHTSSVACIAVTSDGLCLSGSHDKTLRVWEPNTGECLHILSGHKKAVTCVAAKPDGLCVSGSWDKTLRVWDLKTGECLHVLSGHEDSVTCVAIEPDGLCISGSDDCTLRAWNLTTGECLRVLSGHTGWINCVATTPNGLCVSGSSDESLRVWDLKTFKCLRVLRGHSDWVTSVSVVSNRLCVSGSDDNTLRIWDLKTGECLRILNGHEASVTSVAVAPDDLCVSGSDDNTIRVWNLITGECLRTLKGHEDSVECVAVTRSGLCVSGSDDNTLRAWKWETENCYHTLHGDLRIVFFSIAVTPEGFCVSGGSDGVLRVWDWRLGRLRSEYRRHTDAAYCVAVTPDGFCVSGSYDNTLRVLNVHSSECLRVLVGHEDSVYCVAVTPDGLCVSGSGDSTLRVWNYNSGNCLRVLSGHEFSVNCVAVTPDGLCVSGSGDKTLRIWDLTTGKCLHVLSGHKDTVRCVVVTPDGLCISGSDDKTLRIWDYQTGECLRVLRGHKDWVGCVAVAPDGLCVSGSDDNTLRVWDYHTGSCLCVLSGHENTVTCVEATPDGFCLSGSRDGTLRVWDYHIGECLHVITPIETSVCGMDFSRANLDPELAKILWQNGATVPEQDEPRP